MYTRIIGKKIIYIEYTHLFVYYYNIEKVVSMILRRQVSNYMDIRQFVLYLNTYTSLFVI